MAELKESKEVILRELGDGLILRRATPEDAEALADFNARVHSDDGWDHPEEALGLWTRDLLCGNHPTVTSDDFTVVEDKQDGAIVSSLVLIPQTWRYEWIEFGVGRPEMVGTNPDYRRRGLVRAQFEEMHARSAAMGHKVQAITGIPWYYRQFGYEMALDLGGGRAGSPSGVPELKEGEQEPYRGETSFALRQAQASDLDFIADQYQTSVRRYPVACLRDGPIWRYDLEGRSHGSANEYKLCILETGEGEPLGYLAHPHRLWDERLHLKALEVKPGISWLAVVPVVLRYLKATGEALAAEDEKQDFKEIFFNLGAEHLAYEVAARWLPRPREPYAWYLRLADLPDFLRLVSPALEARLARSPLVGHSGELTLSFYRSGARLVFAAGKVNRVEPWQPKHVEDGMALFPDLTFLQLLFGYRSFEELKHAFADCHAEDKHPETEPLLNALFPKRPSNLWALA